MQALRCPSRMGTCTVSLWDLGSEWGTNGLAATGSAADPRVERWRLGQCGSLICHLPA